MPRRGGSGGRVDIALTVARRSGCPVSAATTRPLIDAVATMGVSVAGRALVSRGGNGEPWRGIWIRGDVAAGCATAGATVHTHTHATQAATLRIIV
jgi:hypothetical protein